MHELRPDPLLAAHLAAAEVAAELQARTADVDAGLAPVWARRSMFPHELAARISFAALADQVDVAAAGIGRRLAQDRAQLVVLLVDWLTGAPNATAAAVRLADVQERGLLHVPGAGVIVSGTERALLADLDRLAAQGATRAAQEAIGQGVDLSVAGLDLAARAQLEAAARRLAVAPHLELVAALQVEAARLGPVPMGELLGQLEGAGLGMAQAPLDLLGRTVASQADGLGRQAVAEANPEGRRPSRIYASEILDGRQCIPCQAVDGREYSSLPAARLDYPTGIYRACEGRDRCRGTLVFVWDEATPTTATPL